MVLSDFHTPTPCCASHAPRRLGDTVTQMSNYLNEFIETIQGVPDEVQRNFCLIRDLDVSYTAHHRDLLKLHHDYLDDLRK